MQHPCVELLPAPFAIADGKISGDKRLLQHLGGNILIFYQVDKMTMQDRRISFMQKGKRLPVAGIEQVNQ